MKRYILLISLLLSSIGVMALRYVSDDLEQPTYHPFVEADKKWCIHGFSMGGHHSVTEYHFAQDEEETINGQTYLKLFSKNGDNVSLEGLFREENQRVYLYSKKEGKEYLTYDFSLQEGDEFEPEFGDYSHCKVKKVTYEEINGERLKVIIIEAHDKLLEQYDVDTTTQVIEWIEGIGHRSSPLYGLFSHSAPSSWSYNTAYVLYHREDYNIDQAWYLPFSFGPSDTVGLPCENWWGQQPQNVYRITTVDRNPDLHYEFIPDSLNNEFYTLHVYGRVILNCGPNHYAYCVLDSRSSVNKVSIQFVDIEPLKDGGATYSVDLYFPYFLSQESYVAVDEQGEHPIAVKQETPEHTYCPFIEKGKRWKTFDRAEGYIYEYYFEDGNEGAMLKRNRIMDNVPIDTCLIGVCVEHDKIVYIAKEPDYDKVQLLYDFDLSAGTEVGLQNTVYTVTKKENNTTNVFKGYIYTLQPSNTETGAIIWMEGIGSTSAPMCNVPTVWSNEELLSCFYVNTGEVLYLNPHYDGISGDDLDGQTSTGAMRVKRRRIDFTHTIKIRPHAPRLEKALGAAGAQEPTLSGSYSAFDFVVNFGQLDGVYDVTLLNADDVILYRGSLQANRFVALTRELRNYPQGTYRLIVENDEDLYSASLTLPFDDTAIHSPQSSIINHQYFDLSGRRLSTPPTRGLFIRDGKVVIK